LEAITTEDIVQSLRDAGLMRGCKLLVHSSLSSFGHVEGGADAVIDALLEVTGAEGTVLVPTLTGSEELSQDNPPTFDLHSTPCWTGQIPETFRQREAAIRSAHPTHSVAAIGADALKLTEDHEFSITPCDTASPYGKLARQPDGFVLLLGVDHESSTLFHHVEEVVGVDYHMQAGFARARLIIGDQEIHRHYMLHQYGTPRSFNIMEEVFMERGIQQTFQIGKATVRLVKALEMVDLTVRCLTADHSILCQR
jgi:aminoglycoside 3-N-acetyltransferase